MKKIISLLLMVVFAVISAGCATKEQKASYDCNFAKNIAVKTAACAYVEQLKGVQDKKDALADAKAELETAKKAVKNAESELKVAENAIQKYEDAWQEAGQPTKEPKATRTPKPTRTPVGTPTIWVPTIYPTATPVGP